MRSFHESLKMSNEGLMELQGEEQVVSPENISIPDSDNWTGAGSGWETYHEVMSERLNGKLKSWEGNVFPHAQDILPLARSKFQQGLVVAAELAIPVYLRDQVAWKK